jgi:hypothetical protein
MKSLGRIAYETWEIEMHGYEANKWAFLDNHQRDLWETIADAVIVEYENRQDDEKAEGEII